MPKTEPRILVEFASDKDHEKALDLLLDAHADGVQIPEGTFIGRSHARMLQENGVKFKEVVNAKPGPLARLLNLLAS
jgi:hypothetical protein